MPRNRTPCKQQAPLGNAASKPALHHEILPYRPGYRRHSCRNRKQRDGHPRPRRLRYAQHCPGGGKPDGQTALHRRRHGPDTRMLLLLQKGPRQPSLQPGAVVQTARSVQSSSRYAAQRRNIHGDNPGRIRRPARPDIRRSHGNDPRGQGRQTITNRPE